MKDELEDFIRNNREAFDDKEPREESWQKVKASLPREKTEPWYNSLIVWRAAAILFMGLSFYLLIPKGGSSVNNTRVAMKEFNDVEAFYTQQISQKVEMIDEISEGAGVEEFTQDFQQLEAMYVVLKEEWKENPTKQVKDALVLNMLVRINLLNQQLKKLEEEYRNEDTKAEEKQNAST
jgi:hypothetical protein